MLLRLEEWEATIQKMIDECNHQQRYGGQHRRFRESCTRNAELLLDIEKGTTRARIMWMAVAHPETGPGGTPVG